MKPKKVTLSDDGKGGTFTPAEVELTGSEPTATFSYTPPTKTYLGDSVYADLDNERRIVLTTENGLPNDPSNRIVLEPEVFEALHLWLRSLPKASP